MNPLYQQLALQLQQQIDQGLLLPGQRLPGVRRMATQQGVSVATVVSAYQHLEAQGLLEARQRSGYYVCQHTVVTEAALAQPALDHLSQRPTPVTGQDLVLRLVQATHNPDIVQLGAAVPDPSFLPTRLLEQAMIRASRNPSRSTYAYEFPPGLRELRRQIARRMAASSCLVRSDAITITNGCQEALTLALRAVTQPGDVVAVESPTFYGLLQVVESLGLQALEIPTHAVEGVSIEALALALERWPVKAVVLVPHCSNPLGYSMSDARKRQLLALLKLHQIPLIEDDVYGDLAFSGQRPTPLRGLPGGEEVIHCSSFSKTLSPGLRLGWVVAPRALQEKIEYQKYVSNLAANSHAQQAMASLLARGGFDRHLRQVRSAYQQAVARMSNAVRRYFPEGTRVTTPAGGFVLWVELPSEIDTWALAQQALPLGISIAPGPIFSATRKYRNFLRLSCATPWSSAVEGALATLARLMEEQRRA